MDFNTASSVSYVAGTTQLLNSSGAVISALPDGITQGGINIGNLPGSTTEFVNFQVKVSCPPVTYTATETASVTANATANATAQCAAGDVSATTSASASGSATASATETATSTISQADANQKALSAAQTAAGSAAQSQAYKVAYASAYAAAEAKCTKAPAAVMTTTTTPPSAKTTQLVNTGPGDVFAIFGGSAIAGTLIYNLVLRRKALRR